MMMIVTVARAPVASARTVGTRCPDLAQPCWGSPSLSSK